MQRSRPATNASARNTASSAKTGGGTANSARARTASVKAGGSTTSAPAAKASKAVASRIKAPAIQPPQKRALSAALTKAKSAAAVSNQEEQPQQEENNEEDHEVAEEANDCAISDAATVGWLVGSDYRLVTAVRVRPMLPAEKKKGYRRIVDMAPPDEGGWTRIVNPVALTSPLSPPSIVNDESQTAPPPPPASKQFTHEFAFDHSFWSYDHASGRQVATQGVVYEALGGLAIETVVQGSNCAILAYGQSGTGKTFTMTGGGPIAKAASTPGASSRVAASRTTTRGGGTASTASGSSSGGASRRGLTPRICRGLFDRLDELQQDFGDKSAVHVSYVEVYNERVYDLLFAPSSAKRSQEPLKVREHPEQGTYVENARQVKAATFDAVQALLEEGNRQRSVVSTTANARSSRSHAVMTITLTHQTPPPLSAGKEGQSAIVKKTKLFLVDLAGSERADPSETDNSRQRETSSINKSLSTLADVISALDKRSTGTSASVSVPFVPYRNSVLTRLLKESLGGDATTVLLATISPCCAHFEDTLSTLKFVGRAKNVLSVPKLPSLSPSLLEPAAAMSPNASESGFDIVHELQKEILELKEKLEAPPPDARPPSFALSWESPSPDAVYSRPFHNGSSDGGGPSSAIEEASSAMVDAVADATRWAMQSAAAPIVDEPRSCCSHSELDVTEKQRLEEKLAELQATLSRKEFEFECQRVTTRALQDRVAAQILSQHLILSNLLSIRRRWLQLQAVRAFQRWRSSIRESPLPEKKLAKCVDAEIQSDPPLSAGRNESSASSVELDALCHSVVGSFVFTADEQAQNAELSLQNASRYATVDYDEVQQQAMDCNTLSIIIDGFGDNSDLEGGSPPEEFQEGDERHDTALSTDHVGNASDEKQQCVEARLASCLDSIDLARKAMGPTLRRLRQHAALSPPARIDGAATKEPIGSLGAEQSLLMSIDKRLVTMNQVVEVMRDGLAQRNLCTVSNGVASSTVFELLEVLVSAFCLHVLGRVNDQLVSGVSGCVLGRQEIEMQLKAFREQLVQLIQLANAVMARGELHPRDHDAVLLLVVELVAICERVECAWLAVEQRKRNQLVNRRLTASFNFETEQLNAKIHHMNAKSITLSESLDAQVLETARVEDELASMAEKLRLMEESHAAQVAALEIQLAECEARASDFEKSNAVMVRTAEAQTFRIEHLEQQLAELNANLKTLHESQDGSSPGDEGSPIALRCGNLMVRLEEELTSALSRMNAMDPGCESNSVMSPLASMRASPSASPLMKEYDLQLAAINSELSELAAETPMEDQRDEPSSQRGEEMSSDGEDVGEVKTLLTERDLLSGSAHQRELKIQLAEALTQVCQLQTQHETLMGSVHSLNCELSEALERVASLEDEQQLQHCSENAFESAAQMEDQHSITLADAQSALVEMNDKLLAATEQLDEVCTWRSRLEASEKHLAAVATERADLAHQLAEERVYCQELTRQVEAAVKNLTEMRGQAGALRADLESALNNKQLWEVQLQDKDAELAGQATQLSQLMETVEALEAALGSEKGSRLMEDAAVEKQTQSLRDEIRLLTDQVRVLQTAAVETEATAKQYEGRTESLKVLVVSKAATVDTLNQQVATIQADRGTELDRMSASLSAKTSELSESERRYAELREWSNAEKDQIGRLQAELIDSKEKVTAMEKELRDVQRRVDVESVGKEEAMLKLRSELEASSQAARAIRDQLKRVEEEHKTAIESAEQQIGDLQGEIDLLRLLLRTQQTDAVKDLAEREEMASTLDDTRLALANAVAKLEDAKWKLSSLECRHAAELQDYVMATARQANSTEWKDAWSRSIVQSGMLQLQLSAESLEKHRLEQELLRKDTEMDALTLELALRTESKLSLEHSCANLATDVEQLNEQIDSMQQVIIRLETSDHKRESDCMELQLLLTLAEKEKRRLQAAVEKSDSELQARLKEFVEKYAARERELESCSAERVKELEVALGSQAADAREKEAALLCLVGQMNTVVEELKTRGQDLERQLEDECGRVEFLTSDLLSCQAEIDRQLASAAVLQVSVNERDATCRAQAIQMAAASSDNEQLMSEVKELSTQCEGLQERVAHTLEWKYAWSRSITESGALKLQVASMKVERRQLDEALAVAHLRAKTQDTEIDLLRSELRRALGINATLETARARLEAGSLLRESRLAEVQAEVCALTLRSQQLESEELRLANVCQESEREKQALQELADQNSMRIQGLEAAMEAQMTSHAALVHGIEDRHRAKIHQLEQSTGSASQQALEHAALWEKKETAMRAEIEDAKQHVQQLVLEVSNFKRRLENEKENVSKLSVEAERAQVALTNCEATNAEIEKQLVQQNNILLSMRLSHKEVAAQRQSLEERCCKLQNDLELLTAENQVLVRQVAGHGHQCATAVAAALEQPHQRLREVQATALMQLAELESCRSWLATQLEGSQRPTFKKSCDQVEPIDEVKHTVTQHLSSLNEWFDKTIVDGLPDDATPRSVASVTCGVDDTVEFSPQSTRTDNNTVDLESLTNELLELCSATKPAEVSRTDTVETMQMAAVVGTGDVEVEEEDDDDEKKTTISTEFEDVFGESAATIEASVVNDNNAGDGSDFGYSKTTGADVQIAKASTSEPESGTSDAETTQLKSTIWRLKEALDAKDDMLGFMDAKLSYYEQLVGKHQASSHQQVQRRETRSANSMSRR